MSWTPLSSHAFRNRTISIFTSVTASRSNAIRDGSPSICVFNSSRWSDCSRPLRRISVRYPSELLSIFNVIRNLIGCMRKLPASSNRLNLLVIDYLSRARFQQLLIFGIFSLVVQTAQLAGLGCWRGRSISDRRRVIFWGSVTKCL